MKIIFGEENRDSWSLPPNYSGRDSCREPKREFLTFSEVVKSRKLHRNRPWCYRMATLNVKLSVAVPHPHWKLFFGGEIGILVYTTKIFESGFVSRKRQGFRGAPFVRSYLYVMYKAGFGTWSGLEAYFRWELPLKIVLFHFGQKGLWPR